MRRLMRTGFETGGRQYRRSSFLLRAYRSTLSRNYYTLPASGTEMRAVRRISAAFKDIQGGQILGATYDYTHRLIEFKQPSAVELCARRQCCLKEAKPVPVVSCHGFRSI